MLVRASKQMVARICIAVVIFTQLAVAAYACPALSPDAAMAVGRGSTSAMPAGCEMRDSQNPNLCVQHCQFDNQTATGSGDVSVPAITTSVLTVTAPQVFTAPKPVTLSGLSERKTGPPLSIRFQVFRI